jgi:type VII secretion effector (TIGR04197 family)
MTEQLKFSLADYNAALEPIKKLQNRSMNNNENYHTDNLVKSTANSVIKYQKVIAELKDKLCEYNSVLSEDIEMLNNLAADLVEFDENLSLAYSIPGMA